VTVSDATARLDVVLGRLGPAAWVLTLVGGLGAAASTLLRWTFDSSFAGNLTYSGSPGGSQWWTLVLGLLTALGALLCGPLHLIDDVRALAATRAAAFCGFGFMLLTALEIAISLHGLANLAFGAWLGLAATLLGSIASRGLTAPVRDTGRTPERRPGQLPAAVEIAVLVVGIAFCVYVASVLLGEPEAVLFVGKVVFVSSMGLIASRVGLVARFSRMSARHPGVVPVAALLGAAAFPLTQNGNDTNMSIAYQILVFAAAAIGLNIVIGYAGLLDLGYVAFVGAGAYTSAILSGAPSAPDWWHPPFFVAFLMGGLVSALLGVLIGLPTLRLRGDYLAIVTLAFGEIFEQVVSNLDGTNGPQVTGGSNGIFGVPPIQVGRFDFSTTHQLFGIPITAFSNYYLLLLVLIAVIVFSVGRVSRSRIGRAWVAIREDETAAEAMGISTYRLKLLAFAGGALLAGLGGAIRPHVDTAVSPDSYVFQQSTLLVAAVVLGGMGNIPGVILGSTILTMLPEKLRFLENNRLLVFGIALIVVMRFRPEGLLPSTRRRLELHTENDEAPPTVAPAGTGVVL
jgi:branched-chain amino acid transport system permease protein